MDRTTLEQFIHLAVPGKNCIRDMPHNLTPPERAAFDKVVSENLLLEQEKVPHHVSKQALDALIRRPATNDTNASIQALLAAGYRKMTPLQKLERVRALTFTVQELALLDIRRRYPHSDIAEQNLRVASRWLSPELMLRAFGWDTEKKGY